MLNFESNTLVFTFNGAEKKVRFPTVREWEKYAESLKEKGESSSVVIEFIVSLGLDAATADLLELSHLTQILEKLSESKKK